MNPEYQLTIEIDSFTEVIIVLRTSLTLCDINIAIGSGVTK